MRFNILQLKKMPLAFMAILSALGIILTFNTKLIYLFLLLGWYWFFCLLEEVLREIRLDKKIEEDFEITDYEIKLAGEGLRSLKLEALGYGSQNSSNVKSEVKK